MEKYDKLMDLFLPHDNFKHYRQAVSRSSPSIPFIGEDKERERDRERRRERERERKREKEREREKGKDK